MSRIVIFTKSWCGFCSRAKWMLDDLGLEYEEIGVGRDPELEEEMIRRADGRMTVPQIFVDDVPIGGSDDLGRLIANGELERMLDQGIDKRNDEKG